MCQWFDVTHLRCPRKWFGASSGCCSRESRIVVGMRWWVVWCRPGRRSPGVVRGGVCQGAQRRTRGGCRGDVCAVTGRVPGGLQATPEGGSQAPTKNWQVRAQAQGAQVLLRRLKGTPARVGGQRRASCGKYMKVSMPPLPGPAGRAAGELVDGQDRYSHQVRREPGVYERDRPSTVNPPLPGPSGRLRGKSTTNGRPAGCATPARPPQGPAGEARAAGGVLRGPLPSRRCGPLPAGASSPAPGT